ncbi:MFS transporter [Pseudarthrobacter sp. S9]|uniref:MFS transporter n=1 Tax=Pseudarthrobacter sp. S9 TaxID=3418421 RepID=UPI003D0783CD
MGAMFTDPHRRTEVITAWAAASGIGLAIGPVLAGVLLQVADWHAVYVSTIVLGLITLGVTAQWVSESRSPGVRVDVPGLVLATLTVAATVFAQIEGGRNGYGSPVVLSAWIVGAVALVLFVVVELRVPQPMLDVRLFRSASFSAVMLVAAVSLFGFTGVSIVLVLLLQQAKGLSPLDAGVRMLALLGAYVVVAAAVGPLIRRTGFKAPLAAGLGLGGVAALALAGQGPATPFAEQWPLFVLFGVGVGLVAAPATAAALASVAPAQAGMASGAVNAARQLGSVLGPSVLGTLLTTTMLAQLPNRLAERGLDGQAAAEAQAAVVAGHTAAITQSARAAVGDALGAGVQAGLLLTGIVYLIAALAALTLVRNRPHRITS